MHANKATLKLPPLHGNVRRHSTKVSPRMRLKRAELSAVCSRASMPFQFTRRLLCPCSVTGHNARARAQTCTERSDKFVQIVALTRVLHTLLVANELAYIRSAVIIGKSTGVGNGQRHAQCICRVHCPRRTGSMLLNSPITGPSTLVMRRTARV